jgi:hypothetical protein
VLDQQAPRLQPQIAAFQREIQGFFRPGEITLLRRRLATAPRPGLAGADRARDSSVSAVVALGRSARTCSPARASRAGPAIAATIGRELAGIPQKDGPAFTTWRMDESYALERNGRRLPPDDRSTGWRSCSTRAAGAIPELAGTPLSRQFAGAGAVVVPAGTADQIPAALRDVDAVYLTLTRRWVRPKRRG